MYSWSDPALFTVKYFQENSKFPITLTFSSADKKFYACAAFRERKDCDFYQSYGDVMNQKKMGRIKETQKEFLSRNNFSESFQIIQDLRNSTDSSTLDFCHTCSRVKKASCENHHSIQKLSKDSLRFPVSILSQKSEDKEFDN